MVKAIVGKPRTPDHPIQLRRRNEWLVAEDRENEANRHTRYNVYRRTAESGLGDVARARAEGDSQGVFARPTRRIQ
jgi:hypothetical protein